MKTVIRGAHIIDPLNQIDQVGNLYFTDRHIVHVGEPLSDFSADTEINAKGLLLVPGLCDLSVRFKDPGETHQATIESETLAAAKGGITEIICPPDTSPVLDNAAMVRMLKSRSDALGYANIHPLAAMTRGLEGEALTEMAALTQAGAVGISNINYPLKNNLLLRRAMQYASTYNITVFLSPSDASLQGNGCVHEGIVSTRLGLPAIPEAAETVAVARDIALIETSGVRAHINLISCARSVEMIAQAQQRGLPITASVAMHHLLFDESYIGNFDTQYKVLPPLRTEHDRLALIEGLKEGIISATCSDHRPHGNDSKLAPFSEAAIGISGLESLLTNAMTLAKQTSIPRSQIIAALSCNPADICGLNSGHLSPQQPANFALFDTNHEWVYASENLYTRGQNSPFTGQRLTGKVVATYINGVSI